MTDDSESLEETFNRLTSEVQSLIDDPIQFKEKDSEKHIAFVRSNVIEDAKAREEVLSEITLILHRHIQPEKLTNWTHLLFLLLLERGYDTESDGGVAAALNRIFLPREVEIINDFFTTLREVIDKMNDNQPGFIEAFEIILSWYDAESSIFEKMINETVPYVLSRIYLDMNSTRVESISRNLTTDSPKGKIAVLFGLQLESNLIPLKEKIDAIINDSELDVSISIEQFKNIVLIIDDTISNIFFNIPVKIYRDTKYLVSNIQSYEHKLEIDKHESITLTPPIMKLIFENALDAWHASPHHYSPWINFTLLREIQQTQIHSQETIEAILPFESFEWT